MKHESNLFRWIVALTISFQVFFIALETNRQMYSTHKCAWYGWLKPFFQSSQDLKFKIEFRMNTREWNMRNFTSATSFLVSKYFIFHLLAKRCNHEIWFDWICSWVYRVVAKHSSKCRHQRDRWFTNSIKNLFSILEQDVSNSSNNNQLQWY